MLPMLQNPKCCWSHPIFMDLNTIWFKHPSVCGGECSVPPNLIGVLLGRPFLTGISGFDFSLVVPPFCVRIWNAGPFPWCHQGISEPSWLCWMVMKWLLTWPHFPCTLLPTEINLAFFCQTLPFHMWLWLSFSFSAHLSCLLVHTPIFQLTFLYGCDHVFEWGESWVRGVCSPPSHPTALHIV